MAFGKLYLLALSPEGKQELVVSYAGPAFGRVGKDALNGRYLELVDWIC